MRRLNPFINVLDYKSHTWSNKAETLCTYNITHLFRKINSKLCQITSNFVISYNELLFRNAIIHKMEQIKIIDFFVGCARKKQVIFITFLFKMV